MQGDVVPMNGRLAEFPQIVASDAGNLGAKAAFIFGGCMAVTVVWSYFFVPETKARSTAEIDEMYLEKVPMWRWRGYRVAC